MGQANKLTNKQRAFVEHYLQCWNASEAARRAGYTGDANTVGPRLLANVGISSEIEGRLTELKAGADEVITRLTGHARGSMEDFINVKDDGSAVLDLVKAKESGRLHLIKKLKTTRKQLKNGESEITNEIELYDTQSALVQLGRVHGLFNDKLTIDWREKVKQAGYDPDELQRAFINAIRSRNRTVSSGDVADGQSRVDNDQRADMGADTGQPTEGGV